MSRAMPDTPLGQGRNPFVAANAAIWESKDAVTFFDGFNVFGNEGGWALARHSRVNNDNFDLFFQD